MGIFELTGRTILNFRNTKNSLKNKVTHQFLTSCPNIAIQWLSLMFKGTF